MIDRIDRDRLIGILQDYLEERITAFMLDDRISELAMKAKLCQ